MPLVFLDSNAYRQLGIKFVENVDYKNLEDLLESSGNEFGLIEVVKEELLDYYKTDVFGATFSEHDKLHKRYQVNPYLPNIPPPDIQAPMREAIMGITRDLERKKWFARLPAVPPKTLLDFLLHNKKLGKKDNTRDFLIFYTLIQLCKEHNEDHVILISQDEIFSQDDFFQKMIENEKASNFKLYKSIASFLKDFGPQFDFITNETILASLDNSSIKQNLLSDIKCLPSYASKFYYGSQHENVPDIETLEIRNIEVDKFYVVRDYKTGGLKLNVSLKVDIKAIFQPEPRKEELQQFLANEVRSPFTVYTNPNTFGKEGRPIFEGHILFIFEGTVNDEANRIESLGFVDFIPDYYISKEQLKRLSERPVIVEERMYCDHKFDSENGYWRPSRWGGGLSWHYRCTKCGFEHDTGDFYD